MKKLLFFMALLSSINSYAVNFLSIHQQNFPAGTFSLTTGQTHQISTNTFIGMQGDGNVVIYTYNKPVWASDTNGQCSNCLLVFQADGNLVLYNQSNMNPIWSTGTDGNKGKNLQILQDPPYLAITGSDSSILWAGKNQYQPFSLWNGQSIYQGALRLVMQGDGNLVLYNAGTAVWNSNTSAQCPNCAAHFQVDGNLVLSGTTGVPWASSTTGNRLSLSATAPYLSYSYDFPVFNGTFTTGTSVAYEGCNTASHGSHPKLGDTWVGRVLNYGDGIACPPGDATNISWSLTIATMDWAQNKVTKQYKMLDTTNQHLWIENNAYRITTAYDASIAYLNNEYWVAFECHGVYFPGDAASCVGPMVKDANNLYVMDLSRTTLLVKGQGTNTSERHSASVPKLVVHNGLIYVYWTKLLIGSDGTFLNSTIWGAEVVFTGGKLRVKNSTGAIAANSSLAVRVMNTDNDKFQKATDTFQVVSTGGSLITLGGASKSCASPNPNLSDCYNLFLAQSPSPLQQDGFNSKVTFNNLPVGAHEYSGFHRRTTDGKTMLKMLFTGGQGAKMYEYPDVLLRP